MVDELSKLRAKAERERKREGDRVQGGKEARKVLRYKIWKGEVAVGDGDMYVAC